MNLPLHLTLQQVSIIDQKNLCKSRADASIRSEVIRGIFLEAPFISANMSSVTNMDFCIELEKLGALGIMHRAAPDEQLIIAAQKLNRACANVAMSVGVGESQFELAKNLINAGANIIVIDIANGYCDQAINLGRAIKQYAPGIKLVIGNTTDVAILDEIIDFADACKVGIANGRACETALATGVYSPQFTAVVGFKERARELGMPVISDGGVVYSSDAAKAIGAGAASVMMGGVFAACPSSAAEIIEKDGKKFKVYSGMASRKVQDEWRGGLKKGTCPEGTTKYLPLGESVASLIERYSGGLRSAITYSKATDIKSFQDNVKFARII